MNMFRRFDNIFWGLLVVLIDINVDRFDLLPDFVGFILVAVGCRGLAEASRHFSTAGVMSWVLAGLALVRYLPVGYAAPSLRLVQLAVDCAMMWFLLGGVMEFATARNRLDVAGPASKRRVAYVGLRCALALSGFVVQNAQGFAKVMLVTELVCILLITCLVLHSIQKAKQLA